MDVIKITTTTEYERQQQLIKSARTWAKATRKDLLFKLASLNLEGRIRVGEAAQQERLQESVGAVVRQFQGDLDNIAFSFRRHGIFLEHGVGRGRPVRSAKASASAKPWLEPVLRPAVEELADLLSEEYADIIAGDLRFLIPGILDTKIKVG